MRKLIVGTALALGLTALAAGAAPAAWADVEYVGVEAGVATSVAGQPVEREVDVFFGVTDEGTPDEALRLRVTSQGQLGPLGPGSSDDYVFLNCNGTGRQEICDTAELVFG